MSPKRLTNASRTETLLVFCTIAQARSASLDDGAAAVAGPLAAPAGASTIETVRPPSDPYTNGSCRGRVVSITSSRTRPSANLTSSPGVAMYFNSAAVNGLFLSSPSDAMDPALAAKATSTSIP
jgi:hypothetical protein